MRLTPSSSTGPMATPDRIGRANLDGSGVNPNFITTGGQQPAGCRRHRQFRDLLVNNTGLNDTIGHANADGSNPVSNFISTSAGVCGIAADQSFVYWLDNSAFRIGRAPVSGGSPEPNFITLPSGSAGCGIAVDPSFLYWAAAIGRQRQRRARAGGRRRGRRQLHPQRHSSIRSSRRRPAVNPQYVFWSNPSPSFGSGAIGRANINGSSPNPSLIPGVGSPVPPRRRPLEQDHDQLDHPQEEEGDGDHQRQGPGPGPGRGSPTAGTEDVAATAKVKQIGLTITAASRSSWR